jgi:hypothetical protein
MLKVLEEAVAAVRSLDRESQERAANVLLAFLHGSSEFETADA